MATCNLVGCMTQYSCGELQLPVVGTNLAPYVRCSIQGSNFDITVGNESDLVNGNQAVIKSFQLGGSNGMGTEIEIVDEQGGNFEAFMSRLNKDIENANMDYKMKVQWGWINTDCGQTSGGFGPLSEEFTFLPMHVEASFSEGKIKYKLVGSSLLEVVFEARSATIIGDDGNKVDLKTAIRTLFKTGAPEINSVQFYRVNSDKSLSEYGFAAKDGGFMGPKQKWESDQQNKLSTAMSWLESFMTDKKKGVVPVWNAAVEGGEIIFFEDAAPACNESLNFCNRSIGTFQVNAGSCSNVLSFTPTAKWVYTAISRAGGKTGVTSGESDVRPGRDGCNVGAAGAGTMTSTPFDIAQIDQNGFKAQRDAIAAQAAYDYANKRMYSIEAELRIQGDPTIAGPTKTYATTVALIVISPFYIDQNGSGTCGDWLVKPACHPVYSNKAWLIKGVDHSIKEGSYVTTLRLFLAGPGSEVDPNDPFGGLNSGGWVPNSG